MSGGKEKEQGSDQEGGGNRMEVVLEPGKAMERLMTEAVLSSVTRNANAARTFAAPSFGGPPPDIEHSTAIVAEECAAVRAGNLNGLTDKLTAQMTALDALFTDMLGKAASNMGRYPEAVDRYMSIAMKAQSGCRNTAETLARIKRGGKQTVKVVHVHEGGQAVVADTVNNNRTGGDLGAEARNDGQVHEQSPRGPALPGPDPARDGVPLSRSEREEALPAARR